MSEIVVVPLSDLQELIDGLLTRRLKPIEDKLLYAPDTTPISDEEAAMKLNVSVSTIGRWKKSGRIGSVLTAKGRMVRACDLTKDVSSGVSGTSPTP